MKVEIVIDDMYKEPKVMIMTDKITDNLNYVLSYMKRNKD